MQRDLRQLHARVGGHPDLLEFLPKVPDDELRSCYARALCTVAPSRMEGFSIPIVEASANGCPVLAANCAAQAELLTASEDLFDPDDAATLRGALSRLRCIDSSRGRQRARGRRTCGGAYLEGGWKTVLAGQCCADPRAGSGRSSRQASAHRFFVSNAAGSLGGGRVDSFASLGPLAARAEVEVFSDTPGARMPDGVRFSGETDALAHLQFTIRRCCVGDRQLSFPPAGIRSLLMRYGSAAIAHDARMLGFYRILLERIGHWPPRPKSWAGPWLPRR